MKAKVFDEGTNQQMKSIKERTAETGAAALILLLLAVSAILLGGCVKKYSRNDIRAYARKITGLKNLTVSEQYEEIMEDEEGYLDHLWTVTDEDSGITFHILDDYYWALEEVENKLLDDYDSSVFFFLLDKKKIPPDNRLSLKKTENSGLVQAQLVCSFSDLQGLNNCYEDLRSVRAALEEAGYPGLKVPYTVKYNNPIRGAVDYKIDEGDTTGDVGSVDENALREMRRNYLLCALDYRFEEALGEFGEDEIDALVHGETTVRIYKRPPEAADTGGTGTAAAVQYKPSEEEYYEGVIGSPRYLGISFGTLYELLRQEGYQPGGNAWHFSVIVPDGSRLEFSYDFNDLSGYNDSRGKLQKGYYYIRDGKKVRMESYYANHFDASEIERLTGLRVAEDRPPLTQEQQK